MKLLAYVDASFDSELLTIAEAIKRREQDPDRWEKHTYYDIIRLRPMTAVRRVRDGLDSSSFSFIGGAGGGHGRGSKGIAHELAQDILCKQRELTISVYSRPFSLQIDHAEDEVLLIDPNNSKRRAYVDVMLHLVPGTPEIAIWGPTVAVEIMDTHDNTRKKLKLFRDLRQGSVNVEIIHDWHIPNGATVPSVELKRLRSRIAGFWNARIYADYLYARGRIVGSS